MTRALLAAHKELMSADQEARLHRAALDEQLAKLSAMIDAEKGEIANARLCGAYQALNWARSPEAFAPPAG